MGQIEPRDFKDVIWTFAILEGCCGATSMASHGGSQTCCLARLSTCRIYLSNLHLQILDDNVYVLLHCNLLSRVYVSLNKLVVLNSPWVDFDSSSATP